MGVPDAVFESPAEEVRLRRRAAGDPVLKPFHVPIDARRQLGDERALDSGALGNSPGDVTKLGRIVLMNEQDVHRSAMNLSRHGAAAISPC
jgi:hypothetical protein